MNKTPVVTESEEWMKLIIDIPDEYKVLFDTERCKSKFDSLATNEFGYVLRKAFENGTPLDDVKAEIQENINYNKRMNYLGIVTGLLLALDIIDKYMAESEE